MPDPLGENVMSQPDADARTEAETVVPAPMLPSERLEREMDFYWTWLLVADAEPNGWNRVRMFIDRLEQKGWVIRRG